MKILASTLMIAALAAAGTGSAFAATSPQYAKPVGALPGVAACDTTGSDATTGQVSFLTQKIAKSGLTLQSVSTWDSCYLVTAQNSAGKISSLLFDPSTLNQVG